MDEANQSPRRRSRAMAVLLSCAALAGLVLFFHVDPVKVKIVPRCMLHMLTGLHCAGCGSMRAAHAVLSGNLAQAWAYNPLFFVVAPLIGVWIVAGVVRMWTGRQVFRVAVPSWIWWALLGAALLFSVLRNLPFAWAETLRPHILP